ncbi:MAG: ABC transporter ATP-binding protein [Exilispira sp.]
MEIEAKNLYKSYGNIQAVKDFSFKTESGKIYGIIGPNGAGKSTTIRMIMGILKPDSGEIFFSNEKLNYETLNRIGYLPEERGLYKKETCEDVLLYLAELKGKKKKEIYQKMINLLEKFNLADYRKKKIENLSKGMAQKLQFISTVLHDPDYIFLDEPFSGLDPVSVEDLRSFLIELKNAGKVIMFSTHNMEQAERICDNLSLINHGVEVLGGTIEAIKSKFGKNSIIVSFEGDLPDLNQIAKNLIKYPKWVEIELLDKITPQDCLNFLVKSSLKINKFEIVRPSLHSIFIKVVKEKYNEEVDYEDKNDI